MAVLGSIILGMTTDTSQASRGVSKFRKDLGGLQSTINSTSSALAGMLGALSVGAAAKAVVDLSKKASHLEESVNKTRAIFGPMAADIEGTAATMSRAFGISTTEVMDNFGRLGSMLSGAGFDQSNAAVMSKTMVRLANDMSRFNDTSFEVAFQKLRSGLSGESEPLRDFGVFLDEASVKARALGMGLGGLGGELSAAAKIQARATIIMEQAGAAIGAAGREADGASAKFEALGGKWENFMVSIGGGPVESVGNLFGEMGTGLDVLTAAIERNAKATRSWSDAFGDFGKIFRKSGSIESLLGVGADLAQYPAGFLASIGMGLSKGAGSVAGLGRVATAGSGADSIFADLERNLNAQGDAMGKWANDAMSGGMPWFSQRLSGAFRAAEMSAASARGAMSGPMALGASQVAPGLVGPPNLAEMLRDPVTVPSSRTRAENFVGPLQIQPPDKNVVAGVIGSAVGQMGVGIAGLAGTLSNSIVSKTSDRWGRLVRDTTASAMAALNPAMLAATGVGGIGAVASIVPQAAFADQFKKWGEIAKPTSFASAQRLGTAEEVGTVLRTRYGGQGNGKAQEATARNTKDSAKSLNDLVAIARDTQRTAPGTLPNPLF